MSTTDLIHLLPGDIPNLREQGMAVDIDNGRTTGVIQTVWRSNGLTCTISQGGGFEIMSAEDAAKRLKIDLRNRVSRACVAWWALAEDRRKSPFGRSEREALLNLCDLAQAGREMSPKRIDEFARLCLRLAGRTP